MKQLFMLYIIRTTEVNVWANPMAAQKQRQNILCIN